MKEPLRSDLRARALFADWKRLQASAPAPDAPGFLDHYDEERKAVPGRWWPRRSGAWGRGGRGPADGSAARLAESSLEEGTLVWRRAWDHHWSRMVCEAWGIPL